MPKAYIRSIKLRRWFPPNDRVAVCMARLLILREDFFLELRGFEAAKMEDLDANSRFYRRTYFFRCLVRTLFEIRSTIESLQLQGEFRKMLSAQPSGTQNEFKEIARDLRQAHKLLKGIRNAIGGHVSEESVRIALEEMAWDQEALLKIEGPKMKDVHFEFVGEILAGILERGVPKNQKKSKLRGDFKTIANLWRVFPFIGDIFAMYADYVAS